jgi:hypothetical protein
MENKCSLASRRVRIVLAHGHVGIAKQYSNTSSLKLSSAMFIICLLGQSYPAIHLKSELRDSEKDKNSAAVWIKKQLSRRDTEKDKHGSGIHKKS